MTTSVPQPTFGPRGFVAPSEPEVLAGVTADMNAAFGGNLNPSLETPQGQLASSMTALIGYKNAEFLRYANGVDPAFADGRMQDAIGRIYFLTRNPATATSVVATCSGLNGTVIPAGSLAQSSAGDLYASTSAATIGSGGTVSVPFACTVTGPVACPAATLTTIYRAVPGWDSITNPLDGVPGQDVEGRAAFETRRRLSVAGNARSTVDAIRGAVLSVANVIDAYVVSNDTSSPAVIGGVTVPAHALYVAAVGGVGQDIAEAVWTKKPPGVPYMTSGATLYTVYDESPDLTPPYPAYSVYVTTPTNVPILFDVQITDGPNVPSNAVSQVQDAIVSAFSGGDDGPRARIGGTIYASRFFAPIAALGPWAYNIISIQIGTSTANADTVTVDIDEFPTVDASDIAVTLV